MTQNNIDRKITRKEDIRGIESSEGIRTARLAPGIIAINVADCYQRIQTAYAGTTPDGFCWAAVLRKIVEEIIPIYSSHNGSDVYTRVSSVKPTNWVSLCDEFVHQQMLDQEDVQRTYLDLGVVTLASEQNRSVASVRIFIVTSDETWRNLRNLGTYIYFSPKYQEGVIVI